MRMPLAYRRVVTEELASRVRDLEYADRYDDEVLAYQGGLPVFRSSFKVCDLCPSSFSGLGNVCSRCAAIMVKDIEGWS